MPVLGSGGGGGAASGYARTKRGVIIPDGSLDAWRAARNASNTTRTEVLIAGDSTWWGQVSAGDPSPGTNLYSANNYTPVAAIRAQAAAAGFAYGGPGTVSYYDSGVQQGIPGGVDPISRTGLTAGLGSPTTSGTDANSTGYGAALTAGQTLTAQVVATCMRIIYNQNGASFTYSINGAAAVTVSTSTGGGWNSVYLSGMPGSGATNTVVITGVSGTANIDQEHLNATGIVFHRHCVPSAQYSSLVHSPDDTGNNSTLQVAVGGNQTGTAEGTTISSTAGTKWRKISASLWTYGINDITAQIGSPAAAAPFYNAEAYLQALNLWIQATRAVGADPIVVIPHLKAVPANHSKAGALFTHSMIGLALGNGCAVIDANEAFGGPGPQWPANTKASGDAHLFKNGYTILGNWIWANVLSL